MPNLCSIQICWMVWLQCVSLCWVMLILCNYVPKNAFGGDQRLQNKDGRCFWDVMHRFLKSGFGAQSRLFCLCHLVSV